MTASGL